MGGTARGGRMEWRHHQRMGGRRGRLWRQGVRGISWWLCIRRGSGGGFRWGFRPPATVASLLLEHQQIAQGVC